MGEWTLQHGATTQSLAEWGLSNAVLTRRSWTPSTLTFSHDGAEFDATPLFAYGAALTLRLGGVIKYKGTVRAITAHAQGSDEGHDYTLEDVLGDLNRRVFGQTWSHLTGGIVEGAISARVVLFDDGGESQTVTQTVQSIVAAAIAAGVAVQMGAALHLSFSPRKLDVKNMTFLECLKTACVYSPDVCTQVDDTTDPPTLHFIRLQDATAHNLSVIEAAESFNVEPHYDQRIEGVYIAYETRGTLSGVNYLALNYDIYPEGTAQTDDRVLFQVIPLQGASGGGISQLQTQQIETRTIDENDLAWWELALPVLAGRNEDAELSDVVVLNSSGESTTARKELISGSIQPFMGGTNEEIIITALFNGLIDGVPVVNQQLQWRGISTSLASNTYTNLTSSSPSGGAVDEAVPTGVAESYYTAMNPIPWQGSWELISAEITDEIKPGDKVNFTGTAHAGWDTAGAQVQEVVCNIHAGTLQLTFGRPDYLAPQDFIQLLHEQRKLAEGNSSQLRFTGISESWQLNVNGPTFSPATSASAGQIAPAHPFQVRRIGTTGNLFRVEAGTYNGQPIAAQTVDIGGTRPYAIHIWPQYTLVKWGSQHVYSATLLTAEESYPALTGSSSVLGSVLLLDDGDEARCIIAQILTGNVIDQYAQGNVIGQIEDAGLLDGTASILFDTNA